ncbi:hypothetical protein TNCV_1229401 [Trichonephila clavipes]|nr:hypothetical protein TNCV_1229401 [Trichonephila clavipes]
MAEKTDWDEELLPDIREKFEQWCSEASFLRELQIPRYALQCDSVNCPASKSRVAPLKVLTLPRLELMGALLAARLAKEISRVLNEKISTTNYFLDRFDYSLELDSRSQQQMEGFRRQPSERDTIFNRQKFMASLSWKGQSIRSSNERHQC